MGDTGVAPPFPTPQLFTIVALETFFTPLPELTVPSPHSFKLIAYDKTPPGDVASRIQDADIVVTTTVPIRADALAAERSPKLKLIAVLASGTDSIDLAACAARGIRVLNSPNCNTDAVAEHAVALYFTVRRSIVPTMLDLRAGEWPRRGTLMKATYQAQEPPRGCKNETVVIIGNGGVGRHMTRLFSALGMKVVIAGRKGAGDQSGRVGFEEGLKMASVIAVSCPRTPETLGLISDPELSMMKPDALLVNVSRGGIVDEDAVLRALKDGRIAGAATDVFEKEPASPETSSLLRGDTEGLNLVTTPHTAWIGSETTEKYQQVLQENIDGFILGAIQDDRIKA
ncbi:D-isomer-specific 2-hydroxyacid dehydrogenase family protein [Thozetella sp. PMI_491]|nr:D-isomer-specific 2-hydroxyacid dehydrogenase family protein [Thozetella sp. PMI_491]